MKMPAYATTIEKCAYAVDLPVPNKYVGILKAITNQLSDGKWEGSPAKEKYWKLSVFGTGRSGYCKFHCTGDYIWFVAKLPVYKFRTQSVCKKYASFLKAIMKDYYIYEVNKQEYPTFARWFNKKNTCNVYNYGFSNDGNEPFTVAQVHEVYTLMNNLK